MEACATAHQWAREVKKLGHDTRLMPPTYVKAYVKRGKNDAADAAAICEAVTRPSMRFVPIKNVEQQSVLMLHRTRDLLIRQRTQLINALRAHLAELGLVAAKGREGVHQLVRVVTECGGERLPSNARFACQAIVTQLHAVQIEISGLDKRITQTHRVNADSKRLDTQDGADRLGRAGQGRAVSGANMLKQRRRPSGGLNRSHCIARLRRGRKAKSRVMMA